MTTLPARPSRTVAVRMPPADGRDRCFSYGPHRRRIHRVAHSGLWLMGSDRRNPLLALGGWASVGMALSCVSAEVATASWTRPKMVARPMDVHSA